MGRKRKAILSGIQNLKQGFQGLIPGNKKRRLDATRLNEKENIPVSTTSTDTLIFYSYPPYVHIIVII
jgi:hypothetical protein